MEDLTVYAWCSRMLKNWGVNDPTSTMVLYAMIAAGLGYDDACGACGVFKGASRELIHSRICYQLIAAGGEVHPEQVFGFLTWKWEEEHENRVSVGQGS